MKWWNPDQEVDDRGPGKRWCKKTEQVNWKDNIGRSR